MLVGGHDVKTLDPTWLHRHVALVGQEPVLFAMTIKDNIKYGNVQLLGCPCALGHAEMHSSRGPC